MSDMIESAIDWFAFEKPEFVHSEACTITGVSSKTLQNWTNRFPGATENRNPLGGLEGGGKGSRRIYETRHLATITFARELIAIGFETGLALSVAASLYIALLKRWRDATKAGKPAHECERAALLALAFVTPDKDKFKHRIELCDAEERDGAYSFPVDRGGVYLPVGPLLSKTIEAALKIEMAKAAERKAAKPVALAEATETV